MRTGWLGWAILALAQVSTALGQGGTYTVDSIAAGILAGEAQYTNLKLAYSTEWPHAENGKVISWDRTMATYAQQLPGNKEFLDAVVVSVGSDGHDVGAPKKDVAIVFDGAISRYLDRSKRQGKRLTGLVVPGKIRDINMVLNPTHYLWRLGPKTSFGEVLTMKGSHMEVKGKTVIQGLKCMYLHGTIMDGTAELSLWVCPDRNFMPIKMRLVRASDNRVLDEREARDLIRVGEHLWYPTCIQYGNSNTEWSRLSFEIKSVSTEVLPDAVFTLKFPVDTHVTDHVIKSTYTVTNDAGIDIDNIMMTSMAATQSCEKATADGERVLRKYTENVEKEFNNAVAPAPHRERSALTRLWPVVGAGVIALLIVGILLVWRKKGSRKHE